MPVQNRPGMERHVLLWGRGTRQAAGGPATSGRSHARRWV